MQKRYKIGEFSKNLGVSTGFLKHHESYGLLRPQIAESGYRYYEFPQSMLVLQCIRLQNIGFTSKEISNILINSSDINITQLLLQKKEEFQNKIIIYEEILSYLEQLSDSNRMFLTNGEWSILTPEPFYYIENVVEGHFSGNQDLQDILQQWNQYMPLVETCYRFETQQTKPVLSSVGKWCMGLAIEQSRAERLRLPQNSQVHFIVPGKCLLYRSDGIRQSKEDQPRETIRLMLEKPLSVCSEHHLTLNGDIFSRQFFCSTAKEKNYVGEYYYIPVQ